MYKRFLGFSWMEWTITGMGLFGAIVLYSVFPDSWWKMYISGYGLGLTFEATTEKLYTYQARLSEKHCVGRSDVNLIFPFGWLEMCALTAFFAERVWGMNLFAGYIVGSFIVGNINEFFFYKLGFWQYNYEEKLIGNYRPFMPKITISGVPVQVMFGYCNLGAMMYVLCRILH